MKLREKIFKEDSDGLFNCEIFYNQELTKGLYLVGDDSYIKRNVKALDIKYQVPETKGKMGVKFSRQYKCVLLTVVILDDNMNKQKIQKLYLQIVGDIAGVPPSEVYEGLGTALGLVVMTLEKTHGLDRNASFKMLQRHGHATIKEMSRVKNKGKLNGHTTN